MVEISTNSIAVPVYVVGGTSGQPFSGTAAQPVAVAPYPIDSTGVSAVPIKASSGNVANATATASLAGVAAKTTYITGFDVTGSGATAGSVVSVTVTGLLGGTSTYTLAVSAGAAVGNAPLVIDFVPPLPASAVNTAIVVTCPALGLGNTNNTVNAYGYYI